MLFATAALRRSIRGSGWQRWIVPTVFALGVGAQGLYHLTHPVAATRLASLYLPDVPRFFALRVAGGTVVGDGFLKDLGSHTVRH